MYLDRSELDIKSKEIVEDISNKKASSGAWLWIACGAVAGFVLSCMKFKRQQGKPILATWDKKEKKNEQFSR